MNTSRHAGYTAGWISSSLNSQPYVDILKKKKMVLTRSVFLVVPGAVEILQP